MASIKFTTKDIFEQDFKIGFRGYDQDEVNDFLDDIMKDYDAYEADYQGIKRRNCSIESAGKKFSQNNSSY